MVAGRAAAAAVAGGGEQFCEVERLGVEKAVMPLQQPQQFAVGNTKNINVCGLIAKPPLSPASSNGAGHLCESSRMSVSVRSGSMSCVPP